MINMLAISEATSIAVHLCVRLTQTGDDFFSTRKVAEELDLSVHHLAKVVQKLVKAGILESSRGSQGGVKLRKGKENISVAELNAAVVDLAQGGCLLSQKVCTGCKCSFGRWMADESSKIDAVLRQTTIQEIAASMTEAH
jgi:Rrf2 family protein